MQLVDVTSASVALANQATDGFAELAATTDPRLLLPLVSVTQSASVYDSIGPRPTLTVSDGFNEASILLVGVHGHFTYRSDGAQGVLIELAP